MNKLLIITMVFVFSGCTTFSGAHSSAKNQKQSVQAETQRNQDFSIKWGKQ